MSTEAYLRRLMQPAFSFRSARLDSAFSQDAEAGEHWRQLRGFRRFE